MKHVFILLTAAICVMVGLQPAYSQDSDTGKHAVHISVGMSNGSLYAGGFAYERAFGRTWRFETGLSFSSRAKLAESSSFREYISDQYSYQYWDSRVQKNQYPVNMSLTVDVLKVKPVSDRVSIFYGPGFSVMLNAQSAEYQIRLTRKSETISGSILALVGGEFAFNKHLALQAQADLFRLSLYRNSYRYDDDPLSYSRINEGRTDQNQVVLSTGYASIGLRYSF